MAEIWVMYFGAQFCIAAFSCNFKQAITKLFLFSNYRYLKSEATKHIKPTTKKKFRSTCKKRLLDTTVQYFLSSDFIIGFLLHNGLVYYLQKCCLFYMDNRAKIHNFFSLLLSYIFLLIPFMTYLKISQFNLSQSFTDLDIFSKISNLKTASVCLSAQQVCRTQNLLLRTLNPGIPSLLTKLMRYSPKAW